VREVSFSVVGIVSKDKDITRFVVNRKIRWYAQIGALSDNELHQVDCGQGAGRMLLLVNQRVYISSTNVSKDISQGIVKKTLRWLDGNAAGLSEPNLKGSS
jgi:hypothetical protein